MAKFEGLTLVPYPDPYRPFADDPTGTALLAHIEDLLSGSCPGNDDNLIPQAARVGGRLLTGLAGLRDCFEVIGDVRGRGLAVGVELVDDRESRAPAAKLAAQVVYRAFELGAVFYYVGMNSNVLELTPPLTLSVREADSAVEIISQAIKDAIEGRVSAEKLAGFEGW